MAYEDLLKSVEESAQEKEQELRKKAAAAIGEMKDRASRQAATIRQAAVDEAKRSVAAERNKTLYLIRTENKELLIRTRETVFDQAFAQAEERLANLRADPEYPRIFHRLLAEAAETAGMDRCLVHTDPRDEELAKKAMADLHLNGEIRLDLETRGGVIITLHDGTVVIKNTIESRLERAREHNRHTIHAILSGE
ncbi:MAG: hypothetical protein GYA23_06740 [Methanomicrobiales archaeon]|nr:hypothetical protein [Methanomicrobiales archaeon]